MKRRHGTSGTAAAFKRSNIKGQPMSRTSRTSDRLLWIAAGIGAAAVINGLVARRTENRHPANGLFVDVDGVRVHYLDDGPKDAAASPVVMLHGNGVTAQDFVATGLVASLARERRVIVFDRPGFGYSDRPRNTIWTPYAQAKLIGGALKKLDVDRPIVVGHSWGTLVALAVALEMPRDVAGLVLLSGYYFPTVRADVPLSVGPAIPLFGD
jgi:pimeloyl-ACP methyl ester carboxylesterase